MRLFLAGATGAIGFEIARQAHTAGHWLRTLSRSPEHAKKLEPVAQDIQIDDVTTAIPDLTGIDCIVSALGAPVAFSHPERRSFHDVDLLGNRRLLEAALAAGVPRFVYISVHVEPGYARTAYIRAHERFVMMLQDSGLSYTVIRPTGLFPAYTEFLKMGQRGLAFLIGNGRSRVNPIHPADAAAIAVAHLESGPREVSCGGPDTFTRRQIVELAFSTLGKRPRIIPLPAPLFRFSAALCELANPRLGELLEFAAAVSVTDSIAPTTGTHRLPGYFHDAVHRDSNAS